MRIAAVIVLAFLAAISTALPVAAAPAVEELFQQFGLFGSWAGDCQQPATPDNPHVSISMPTSGLVLEDHDLGTDFAVNHYSILSAERVSAERLAVEVIFQPGAEREERQNLVFLIRNDTRRTMFNQPDGGPVRVKDGIALARRSKTPLLRKCE
jgi:hypothetical protein